MELEKTLNRKAVLNKKKTFVGINFLIEEYAL